MFEYCSEDGDDVRKTKKFKTKDRKKAYEYLEDQKTKFKEAILERFVIHERIIMNNAQDVQQALVSILSQPNLQLPTHDNQR